MASFLTTDSTEYTDCPFGSRGRLNRFALVTRNPIAPGPIPGAPGQSIRVMRDVRGVLANPASAPTSLADPRIVTREPAAGGNSQVSWTFDGVNLMLN